jgi:hypothetical protein
VAVNSKATVAAFATYIYLATNVVPQRQKIIGFNVQNRPSQNRPSAPPQTPRNRSEVCSSHTHSK